MVKKYILITGLTGLVGSGFLYNLVSNSIDTTTFVALCRESSNVSLIEKRCIIERGSTWDNDFLEVIFSKYRFEKVIHISNKSQIFQFAFFASKYHIKQFIAISSTYSLSKKHPNNSQIIEEDKAVKLLQENNVDYVLLRPTSIFGTRPDGKKDRNISIFSNYIDKFLFYPLFKCGKASVQPVWGRDVGLALYIAYTKFDYLKNHRLVVSGDKKRTYKELITLIGKIKGKKIRFIYFPGWFGYLFFYVIFYVSLGFVDKRESIGRLLEDKAFETSKELVDLGYKATSFESAFTHDRVF